MLQSSLVIGACTHCIEPLMLSHPACPLEQIVYIRSRETGTFGRAVCGDAQAAAATRRVRNR